MSEQEWRVLDSAGNEHGPYSFQNLQGYYTTGNITHETLVWTEGLAEWIPAGQIQGLLPAAPPAPAEPPAPVGGINLNPQVSVSKGSPLAGGEKKGAPLWLSMATLLIGITSIILYFFPWVSTKQDVSPSVEEKIVQIFSQTGMQSITGEKEILNSFSGKIPDFESSTMNLVAIIAIVISVVLAFIGLLNKLAAATTSSQLLLALAGLLIGIQMARQFPIVEAYTTAMKKATKVAEQQAKTKKERRKDFTKPAPEKVDDKTAREKIGDDDDEGQNKTTETASKPKADETKTVTEATKIGLYYKSSFEPGCFIVIGLLTSTIFLLVITISASNSTPLIIPQGGFQSPQGGAPPQQPDQPQQPGAGLKFH